MSGTIKLTESMIAKALAAYHAAGGVDETCVRAALEAALADDSHFAVGDEVACEHGCLTGVILAIDGDVATISWLNRGKSSERLDHLVHMEEPGLHSP
jgi:hypothetical protein